MIGAGKENIQIITLFYMIWPHTNMEIRAGLALLIMLKRVF